MGTFYKIGTRSSPLALKQVEEVLNALREFYPAISAQIASIDTYGDRDKNTPISDIEGSDFFTKEIEDALLRGEIDPSTTLRVDGERSRTIDFAVHSAKDLSDTLREGLSIAAITKSIDSHDVLVSKRGLTLDKLPRGATIGTSSRRRKEGLKKYRPDFNVVDIRGNIGERLAKLDNSDLDGIVTAGCALRRLGLKRRITQIIPFEIIEPHSMQGALTIVARKEDTNLIEVLSILDSREKVSI